MPEFAIMVIVQGGLAIGKPSIQADNELSAKRQARKLYGRKIIVIEHYDPHYYDSTLPKSNYTRKNKKGNKSI